VGVASDAAILDRAATMLPRPPTGFVVRLDGGGTGSSVSVMEVESYVVAPVVDAWPAIPIGVASAPELMGEFSDGMVGSVYSLPFDAVHTMAGKGGVLGDVAVVEAISMPALTVTGLMDRLEPRPARTEIIGPAGSTKIAAELWVLLWGVEVSSLDVYTVTGVGVVGVLDGGGIAKILAIAPAMPSVLRGGCAAAEPAGATSGDVSMGAIAVV